MKIRLAFSLLVLALSTAAQNPQFQYTTVPLSPNMPWMDILGVRQDATTQKIVLAAWSASQKDNLKPLVTTDQPFDINYAANHVNRSKLGETLKKVEPDPSLAGSVSAGLCSKEISQEIIRTMRVVGFDLVAEHPDTNIGQSTVYPRLKYVDYANSPVRPNYTQYLPLNKEKNAQALPFFTEEKISAYAIDNGKFIGIASDARRDRWDHFVKKRFITFNYKGEVLGIDSFNFKYLRKMQDVVPVFNTKGEKTAVFIVFDNLRGIEKAGMNDPEEDRANIIVMGTEGKILSAFEPRQASGYLPVDIKAVVEKDGKYYILSRNPKITDKEVYEQIICDKSGKIETVAPLDMGQPVELVKPDQGSSAYRAIDNYFMLVPTPSGRCYLVGHARQTEKIAGVPVALLHGVTLLEMDQNLKPVRWYSAALPKSSFPAIVDLVRQNGEAFDLVITAPGLQNLVCRIRPAESEGYAVRPATSFMPVCGSWGMNYLLDTSKGELQFFYLPKMVSKDAQMVSVPLK